MVVFTSRYSSPAGKHTDSLTSPPAQVGPARAIQMKIVTNCNHHYAWHAVTILAATTRFSVERTEEGFARHHFSLRSGWEPCIQSTVNHPTTPSTSSERSESQK